MDRAEGAKGRERESLSLSAEDCRSLREELGWSAEQLARAAGVSVPTVLTFEQRERRPREETLIAIRRAFRNASGLDPALLSVPAVSA